VPGGSLEPLHPSEGHWALSSLGGCPHALVQLGYSSRHLHHVQFHTNRPVLPGPAQSRGRCAWGHLGDSAGSVRELGAAFCCQLSVLPCTVQALVPPAGSATACPVYLPFFTCRPAALPLLGEASRTRALGAAPFTASCSVHTRDAWFLALPTQQFYKRFLMQQSTAKHNSTTAQHCRRRCGAAWTAAAACWWPTWWLAGTI